MSKPRDCQRALNLLMVEQKFVNGYQEVIANPFFI